VVPIYVSAAMWILVGSVSFALQYPLRRLGTLRFDELSLSGTMASSWHIPDSTSMVTSEKTNLVLMGFHGEHTSYV
jgi:hypothetical protein